MDKQQDLLGRNKTYCDRISNIKGMNGFGIM